MSWLRRLLRRPKGLRYPNGIPRTPVRTLYEMMWDLPTGAEAVLRRDRPEWFE